MIALVISVIAFADIHWSAMAWEVGEASFAFLAAGTALVGLVLHGFARLQEFDLKNLRIVLRELKETKQELFVREERLKSVALPLVQILAYQGAASGRWGSAKGDAASRAWYKAKIATLIEALGADSDEARGNRKFIDKYGRKR